MLTVTSIRAKSLEQAVELGESVYGSEPQWFHVYRTPLVWEKEASDLFKSQKVYKKDQFVSFTDYVLLVQARKQKIKTIFSFDEMLKRFEKEGITIIS